MPQKRTKKRVAKPKRQKRTGPARVKEILKRLDHMYPAAQCALRHEDPWQLLVATILSAQCTDERVNKVTPDLFRKYPTVQDFANLLTVGDLCRFVETKVSVAG